MTDYEQMTKAQLIEELREKERLFSSAYELVASSDDAIVGMSLDGTISSWNRGAEHIYGYSSREIIGQNTTILSLPHRHDEVLRILERIKGGERIKHFETVRVTKEGRQIHVSLNISPIINTAGEIIGASSIARDITERKCVAEELLLTKFCIDKASITICRTGPKAKILDANEYMCRSLGYTREELTSMSIFDIDPTFTPATWQEHRKKLQATGTRTFETLHRRKDGTTFPVEVTVNYLTFGGKGVGISFARDMTERKLMEEELRQAHDELEKRVAERTEQLERTAEALRASEERYALAVQGSNEGIWDLNTVTGEIYFSPRWKSMLGYKDDEFPNSIEAWQNRIHPDDRQTVLDSRKAHLDGLVPTYEIEYRLQHKDGSYHWIHGRGACLRDSDGRPTRFAGSHADITDRKRIEDDLRESEKKYRTLFEKSNDAIIIWDNAREVIDVNHACTELFGYTREEILLDLEKLYGHREDREQFWQKLQSSGSISDYEAEMKRKDGERIIVHLSISAIKDDAGRISGYQGIFHDMTERKRLERQLLQSQKMESVGILAGGVAHDFNNLLTAISGYGQILQERIPEDDELGQESIMNVLNAADRAAELTRGLLAFSRKQLISPKPVHIDTLIRNTGKLIRRIIGEDIAFSTSFSGENPLVKADPGQIEQVLMNLATNAHDAMPHGGNLSVATRQVVVKEGSETLYDLPSPGTYVLISVADTGTGIDQAALECIFEPFYTTKEVGKGTGLGLAIVHGIIKQHNGSILASSEPGKGTIFNIYLPLIEDHVNRETRIMPAQVVGGKESLLLAEDEEMVRVFVKNILERAGYTVIIADNGEDAVARFREHDDISLVLSDVVMPRKNGKQMLDELRQTEPDVKVLFISGYPAEVMKKKGMFAEGTEFITKPFKKEELLQKVREVLDKN